MDSSFFPILQINIILEILEGGSKAWGDEIQSGLQSRNLGSSGFCLFYCEISVLNNSATVPPPLLRPQLLGICDRACSVPHKKALNEDEAKHGKICSLENGLP